MKNKRIVYILMLLSMITLQFGVMGKTPEQTLPNWAPQHPSPEFLRAAKILTSYFWGEPKTLQEKVLKERMERIAVPAWEFFGTLNDQEMSKLMKSKDLRMRYRTMRPRQQQALKAWLEVWRQNMKDLDSGWYQGGWQADWLVVLYKHGAKQDLSNVLCQFQIKNSRIVRAYLRIIQSDDKASHWAVPINFGYIRTRGE
jgi:hypothetical protein